MSGKVYDENGRLKKIIEDGEIVFDRNEEQKEIAKKTIEALEGTNGRGSEQTNKAKERLKDIFR